MRQGQDEVRVHGNGSAAAEQATLAAIVEWSDDAIFSTRLDGTILTWNSGAAALFGYDSQDILGRNVSLLSPPGHADETPELLTRLAQGEDLRHVETVRAHSDGSIVPVAVAVWPLKDPAGRLIGASILAHDITERRRLQAELEAARDAALDALRAKSQLLANTSHELRTPMTSILGMAELLMRTELDTDQRRMVAAVQRAAERLLGTILEMLDVSAVTTGNLRLESGEVEIRPLVEEVGEFIEPTARAKGLGFVCAFDDDAPPAVYGDPARLRQMLVHLAENAVKFTDRGGVVIRATRPEGDEVPSVRFTVVDTGIGVAARDQWRLFRVFSQVDPTDTRRFGGNGLGLALVAQLAEAMGGTVGVASAPGRGSTFWFDIPVQPRHGLLPHPRSAHARALRD
jgi:PAS domain S-box-containing protein